MARGLWSPTQASEVFDSENGDQKPWDPPLPIQASDAFEVARGFWLPTQASEVFDSENGDLKPADSGLL